MSATKSERVTVWFVIIPWNEHKPKTVSVEGTRTAKMIRLDKSPEGMYSKQLTGRELERACYTEADAVAQYVAECKRKAGICRELAESASLKVDNALWLVDKLAREARS